MTDMAHMLCEAAVEEIQCIIEVDESDGNSRELRFRVKLGDFLVAVRSVSCSPACSCQHSSPRRSARDSSQISHVFSAGSIWLKLAILKNDVVVIRSARIS